MTREKTIRSTVIPPPHGGINTRLPISQMGPEFALELENWIPRDGTCEVRKGNTRFCTSSSPSSRLAVFNYNGVNALLRFGLQVENISTGTSSVISGATVFNGLIWSQFYKDRIFFTGSSSDDVYYWTGSGTTTAAGFVGPGGDDKLLGPMTVYRNRLFFAHYNGTSSLPEVWYTNYDSSTGTTLTQYPMGSLLSLGGYILFIGRITRAKSYQEDEVFVAVSTNGEVLLFTGAYPGSTSWDLIGKYFIPKALTSDSFVYYGADILIMTTQGIVSVSSIMNGEYSNPQTYSTVGFGISGAIQKDYLEAISANLYAYSWGHHIPSEGILFFNISTNTGISSESVQFVMNTDTGAWSKLSGWDPLYGTVWDGAFYFTDAGLSSPYCVAMKAFDGFSDTDPKTGNLVSRSTVMRPAYNFFGDSSHKKKFLFAVPHHYQSEGMQLTMDADIDFKNVAATQVVTPDNADTSYKYYAPTVGLNGVGKCASIRIDQTVTTKRMSIQAIEVFWETGSVL